MEDLGNQRRSSEKRRERRGSDRSGAPRPRPPRRPRAVGRSSDVGPRPQSTRTRRPPQRRSLRSVLDEVKEFTPCLAVDPALLRRANNKKYTGLHRCCTHCTPSSKSKNTGDIPGMCGLVDILRLEGGKFRRLPYRLVPYLSFVVQQPMTCQRDHHKATLSSSRVQEAITKCASDADDHGKGGGRKEQEKRAAGIVSAMSSAVYRPLVRLIAWLFFWTFGHMFERLDIQHSHTAMLLQAQERGVPMVFLPSHKSHMDYLIMTFALFSLGIRIPRVAAGDNLRLPFVSWLVTHLGGFFIKRKLDVSDKKDVLYRRCLHEYMEQLLQSGESLEFFLEGSRSRSGKPCTPKAGLLSVVVDTVREGLVEDVLVVPVNISYDRLVETTFVKNELMGGEKRPETLREALKGVWSFITRRVGVVRVDFSQPFSLQEFLSKAVIAKGSLLEMSQVSRRGSTVNLTQSYHRRLVTALSYHIMYDITLCTSLTPTSMVSFLLLNKFRQYGATIDELIDGYLQLERLAELHGRVISSYLSAGEAVHYAPALHVQSGYR
ncbi:Glycerol-3-phosphate acyltransferase 1, mitochondrial [Geodia barretti]|uniref:Glycerol-3-phosphate acyltransferase 1, mitochondrial n=2 Tax=Geodia barretti TaxID=519541 RepID=A0AA35W6Q2_GEOBA|nr:Glycerol-3-phosphate acyltransferase 1, mitochondrial [Geodia barretti]